MEERSQYLMLSANRNYPDEQNMMKKKKKKMMRMDLGVLVQFLSVFFFFFFLAGGLRVKAERWDGIIISQANYDGLQAFKKSLVDPNGYLKNWNGSGIGACSGDWVGIKCVKGQVIAIQLPWKGLGGEISGKIGQLTSLRKISLHDNSIGGGIPPEIGFLSDLRGLYLFNNRFSGSIPPEIGKCVVLQTLDLSQNSLSGGIPVTLSNSSRLYRLNLSYNNLTGTIPVGLTRSSSLTFLSLNNNNFSGQIPDTWGGGMEVNGNIKISSVSDNHQQLQVMNLDNNSFSGPLPNSITKLRMLKVFTAGFNRINGSIADVEFGKLIDLELLDLSVNNITEFFPASVCNLSSLLQLRLGGNHIQGGLPSAIDGMKNLTVLDLKNNRFNGSIPATIGNMSRLSELDLSDNRFSGEIPESFVGLQNLTRFNVSDNQLSGQVPLTLAKKFGKTSFTGNLQLCGYTSAVPCPSPPPPPPPPSISLPLIISHAPHRGRFSTRDIILITTGCILVSLLLICCILLICLYKKRSSSSLDKKIPTTATATGGKGGSTTAPPESESSGDAGGKLVHFDGPMTFTADDLLCATAEIMGKSTYGTVYKATLEDGSQVAVKRLREKISKGQKEFETEVNVIGNIRHQNLLALRAYYLGPKGEKLLVFDYMPNGSLAAFLHARGPDTSIDWLTRMKIAMGTTRGLLHLHTAHNIIHGNMTSTNILLDDTITPKIADFGLSRLMTTASSATVMATAGALGYRAPELSKLKKANTKTDVYSLGVVILELLTGKLPGEAMNGVDLPQWVASIVKEEWTNEVFDLELIRDSAAGDELLNTLKLALHCVDPSPTARPEVEEVLRQLEHIKPELAQSTSGSTGGGCTTGTAEGAGAGKEEK